MPSWRERRINLRNKQRSKVLPLLLKLNLVVPKNINCPIIYTLLVWSGSCLAHSAWVIRRCVDPLDRGCQNIGHLETSGDRAVQLMSVSAAARHLGYKSRSQLYKLMNDGWLDAHVHIQMPSGQRLLDVDGLKKTLQGLCQWRVDSVFLRRH